jgi:hypothetical protein
MFTLYSEDEIREMFLADYKRRSKKEADLAVSIEELKHLQEELLTTAGV